MRFTEWIQNSGCFTILQLADKMQSETVDFTYGAATWWSRPNNVVWRPTVDANWQNGHHLENLSRSLSDFDEIWHDDAAQPSLAYRPLKILNFKNPRWRRPPSWKIKNRHISATVHPILTKFGTLIISNLLTVPTVKNVKLYKSNNLKITISRQRFEQPSNFSVFT